MNKLEIKRFVDINSLIEKGKVLTIFGPRQCGKTSLVKDFLKTYTGRYVFEAGELMQVQHKFLSGPDKNTIDNYGLKYDLVVIDEAQLVANIGVSMKVLVDLYPNIMVILTGSSSFDLAGQVGEPLYGRQNILNLHTIWEQELLNVSGIEYSLNDRLIYGSYPEVLTTLEIEKKITKLQTLSGGNLFKDILAFDRLKKPQMIIDLVTLLAHQVGNEVSHAELAGPLGVDEKTIENYINILEKTFVIYKLQPFSKNERKEVKTKKKYYFYDLGIRNAVINNFNNLQTRTDVGALWENFCVLERLKRNNYKNNWVKNYFWRAYSGPEIDYLEIKNEEINAFEFKWNANKKIGNKNLFRELYKNVKLNLVNRDNYRDFIL